MAALFGDVNGGANSFVPPGIVSPVFGALLPGVRHNPELPNQEDAVEIALTLGVPFGSAFSSFLAGDPLEGDCVLLNQDLFWNNHVHIIPGRFDLGNVLATSVRNYEIYNGFFAPREVDAIADDGFDGISITSGPDTPPFTIPARSSEFFTVTVSTVGPPNILATKTYDFSFGPEQLILTITGTRVVVFPLIPFSPINEVYEFKTHIEKGISGFEQRTALRDLPRLSYGFPYRRTEEEMAFAENQFYEWMGRLWAMPQWVDLTESSAIVTNPAVNIPVTSTADRDFRAGSGQLGVIYDNFGNFEAFEIVTVNPTSLDILVPINGTFPLGAAVAPVRFAWMRAPIKTNPWLITLRDMNIAFDVVEGITYGDDFAGLATTYKTLPLFDELPLTRSLQYQRTFDKRVDRMDSGIGQIDQNQVQDYPEVFERAEFIAENRSQIAALKRLFMSFNGRQKVVWMPTHRDDFQIELDVLAPTIIMRVKISNYTIFLNDNKRTRADIRVTYVDGTFDLREILGSTLVPGSHEEIAVDTNFTQDMSAANVARIEYIVRRRLTDDTLKLTWHLNEKVRLQLGFKDVLS